MLDFASAGLLSVDSLIASAALAPVLARSPRRWRFAAMFGICDALAYVVGGMLPQAAGLDGVVGIGIPLLVVAYACYCLAAASWAAVRADARIALALPALMSADNLVAGAQHATAGGDLLVQAALLGLVSAIWSCGGLVVGGLRRLDDTRRAHAIAGCALLPCAALLYLH